MVNMPLSSFILFEKLVITRLTLWTIYHRIMVRRWPDRPFPLHKNDHIARSWNSHLDRRGSTTEFEIQELDLYFQLLVYIDVDSRHYFSKIKVSFTRISQLLVDTVIDCDEWRNTIRDPKARRSDSLQSTTGYSFWAFNLIWLELTIRTTTTTL